MDNSMSKESVAQFSISSVQTSLNCCPHVDQPLGCVRNFSHGVLSLS